MVDAAFHRLSLAERRRLGHWVTNSFRSSGLATTTQLTATPVTVRDQLRESCSSRLSRSKLAPETTTVWGREGDEGRKSGPAQGLDRVDIFG